jgi:hypothetical protein
VAVQRQIRAGTGEICRGEVAVAEQSPARPVVRRYHYSDFKAPASDAGAIFVTGYLFVHDLIGKPLHTFPDHAPASAQHAIFLEPSLHLVPFGQASIE